MRRPPGLLLTTSWLPLLCPPLTVSLSVTHYSETRQGENWQSQHNSDWVELPKLLEQTPFLLPPNLPDCTTQGSMQKVWELVHCCKTIKGKNFRDILTRQTHFKALDRFGDVGLCSPFQLLTVQSTDGCQFKVKHRTKAVCVRAKDAFCNSQWSDWSHITLVKHMSHVACHTPL